MLTPKFKLDWTTGAAQPGVDVARTGVATFVDSAGVIQTAAENTQRIDWSSGVPGLLVEAQCTNQILYSEAWTTGASGNGWSQSSGFFRSMVAGNHPQRPGLSVCYFGPNSTISSFSNSINHQVLGTLGSVGIYTAYADYKAIGSTTTVRFLHITADGGTGQVGGVFRLTGGGGLQSNNFVAGDSFSAQLDAGSTPIGNGWYRVFVVFATTRNIGQFRFRAFPYIINSPLVGDGTSGLHGTMAQLESGASATSYIPTEATTVTRNADDATITGTNFSDFWQASKGGVLVRARPGTVSGVRPWLQFDDGTANEIIALRGNTTNPELYIVDGGVAQAQIDAGAIAANTDYSLTGWWATNDCKARLDSGAVVTDTSATIPTVTQARLGSDGANYLNGHLASISYYDSFSAQIYTRRKNKAVFNLM